MTDKEIIKKIGTKSLKEIVNQMNKGHALGLDFISTNNLLLIPSANSFRQNIVNLSIDLSLENACKNGDLDFDFKYINNSNRTCKHIELFKGDYILTHSSGNSTNFPRKAIYRESLCTNQYSLFEDSLNPEMRYGILMHSSNLIKGAQHKISLGIPDIDCRNWSNYIDLTYAFSIYKLDNNFDYLDTDKEKFEFELKEKLTELNKLG